MNTLYNIYGRAKRSLSLPLGRVGLGLFALLPLSGCTDFLEVEPQNIITLEQFWNEEGDVENSIAGCYSALQSYGALSRMMIWGEFRSENIINNGHIEKDIALERVLKENIDASNVYTNWTPFYDVINRCNIIMHYAPEVSAKDPNYTPSELGAHIAECTALRSLCYFYLIRTFRDVPYTEEAYLNDLQTMDVPATPFDVVLSNLIKSLEEVLPNAVIRYPKTNTLDRYYQTGRITRDAIRALLCELYLWKGDYASCNKYADLIINERKDAAEHDTKQTRDYSETNGYPLIPCKSLTTTDEYGAAFDSIFVEGASSETIFELTFVKNNDNMLSNGPVSNFYGHSQTEKEAGYVKPSEYVGIDIQSASPKVFNNKYDGRAYENFRYDKGKESPSGINKYVCMTKVKFGNITTNSFWNNREAWGSKYPTVGKDQDSRNKSNFILYRLTDVMLLKAEALVQMMSDGSEGLTAQDQTLRQEAFSLVNAVNKRSLYQQTLKDTLLYSAFGTKSSLEDLVFDERNREFMFEGKRYFDLVRRARRDGNTDYLRSKAKLKSVDNASVVESRLSRMDAIYWPYNLDEIKVNSNLVQNPAFGSGENSSFEKN